ncbi:MAG: hypothetical protein DMF06_03500 [Verrucomicrobia bacterium]|nr:MAG: hypothetical protein DMF06_03500 [Verrucomicrobiota bacterium]
MDRQELGALLRLLVNNGRLTAAQAADIVVSFDLGEIATSDLPVPPSDLPVRLTTQELAVAMSDVAVRLTPKQAAPFLAAATKPVSKETPPEVKQFLRERLREHFRQNYDNAVAGYTHALAEGGDVAFWHKKMIFEQRAFIARMTTAGLGRPLTIDEVSEASGLAVKQQAYLHRFAGEISVQRAIGADFSEPYLQARIRQYGGVGWAQWFKANETVENRGDGYVCRYISVDSPTTCGPCLDAAHGSPYLPKQGPFPGTVCKGRGLCKCRREVYFDMKAWKALTT